MRNILEDIWVIVSKVQIINNLGGHLVLNLWPEGIDVRDGDRDYKSIIDFPSAVYFGEEWTDDYSNIVNEMVEALDIKKKELQDKILGEI